MAVITVNDCTQYFEDTLVPRLRDEFPNLGIVYTQGKNCGQITFKRTRRYKGLRKYDGIFVWVNPFLQNNHVDFTAIISGSLMYGDSPRCCEFRWENLNVMIGEIRKLERNECCNVCVLM